MENISTTANGGSTKLEKEEGQQGQERKIIDVLEYSPKKRIWLKMRSDVCVYVIAPIKGYPCKIGYCSDIVSRLCAIQNGNWHRLAVHFLLWTPGFPVAARIEELSHQLLGKAKKTLYGEWFAINAEWAETIVDHVAAANYPSVKFKDHRQMIDYLKTRSIDQRDHVTA
jgi:hypothetical protein